MPTAAARRSGRGLALRPFRALRYGAAAGPDVGALTSPPYDLLDQATVAALQAGAAHNIVRLIRPAAGDYAAVASILAAWIEAGVLVRDPVPALYVYEYDVGGHLVRGLVGALALRAPEERVVLPHEDVMPGPVIDRSRLIGCTRAQLEPILLVYDGGAGAGDVVDRVAAGEPLLRAVAPDGSVHRVWSVAEAGDLETVADDLRPRQALIADGHHRYAAYRRCEQEHGRDSDDPWHYGLALLVDSSRHPLRLGAIHRVVRGTDLAAVRAATRRLRGTCVDLGRDATAVSQHWWRAVPGGVGAAELLVTDGDRWLRVALPRDGASVDAAVLHERLLPALGVGEAGLRYVHDLAAALDLARGGDLAVLLQPPTLAQVVAAVGQGRLLPRKSTSFGPKPRMGLLMRQLDP